MGIHKLNKKIQDVLVEIKLSDMAGCIDTLAVDGYCWLYQIILHSEPVAIKYVEKFMAKVNELRSANIKPYIVFDGAKLPTKKVIRHHARQDQRRTGSTDKANEDAEKKCGQATTVTVTHDIVYVLIQTLKQENVSYVVAPYEADPQLAYLCLTGKADAILTSDTDLIAYGCKKIIFRDTNNRTYKLFERSKLESSKAFGDFTQEMVLQTCIMGGCDYLHIPGVGITGAIRAMRDHKGVMREEYDYFKVIKDAGAIDATPENLRKYMDSIKNIMNTFQHQRVYNPDNKTIVHLTNMVSEREEDYLYVGSPIAQGFAEGIATGDLHPATKEKMKVPDKELEGAATSRIWDMWFTWLGKVLLKLLYRLCFHLLGTHKLTLLR